MSFNKYVIASAARQSHRTSNELCLCNLHDEIASYLAMTRYVFCSRRVSRRGPCASYTGQSANSQPTQGPLRETMRKPVCTKRINVFSWAITLWRGLGEASCNSKAPSFRRRRREGRRAQRCQGESIPRPAKN